MFRETRLALLECGTFFLKIDEFSKRMAVSAVNKRVGCPSPAGDKPGTAWDKAATDLL